MAHLIIEYSKGLEAQIVIPTLCQAAYAAIVESGVFPIAGIRVRAHCADHSIVADGLTQNNFATLTLAVGAGRSTQVLKAVGDTLFKAVQNALEAPLATTHFALSLEIRTIDPDLSWKDTPIHARLSGKK